MMAPEFTNFLSSPIAAVNPDDMRRIWTFTEPVDVGYLTSLCPGADVMAVSVRVAFLKLLLQQGILDRWRGADDSLPDKVFEVAARCSLEPVPEEGYLDGHLHYEAQAFLRALERS